MLVNQEPTALTNDDKYNKEVSSKNRLEALHKNNHNHYLIQNLIELIFQKVYEQLSLNTTFNIAVCSLHSYKEICICTRNFKGLIKLIPELHQWLIKYTFREAHIHIIIRIRTADGKITWNELISKWYVQ